MILHTRGSEAQGTNVICSEEQASCCVRRSPGHHVARRYIHSRLSRIYTSAGSEAVRLSDRRWSHLIINDFVKGMQRDRDRDSYYNEYIKRVLRYSKEKKMSEKRLNNTIFLMFLATENYKRKHNMTSEDFLKMDDEFAILDYISECPDIFDSMTGDEMAEEIEQYVSRV